MRNLKLVAVVLVLVVASLAGVASAGMKVPYAVQVNPTSRYAVGAIGSARNSLDTTQYIGCSVDTYADGYVQGWCYAQSPAGVSGSCHFVNNPALAGAVEAMTSDSLVNISWDASGNCWEINLDNDSRWEPKK
jgi:hypothetical protein